VRRITPGQALVELALIAPVLIVLAMIVWDGGAALREQVVLEQAARDGARVAATGFGSASVASSVVCNAVLASARDLPNLTCGAANIAYPDATTVTVSLRYSHALYTPVVREVWGGSPGTLTLTADASFYVPPATQTPLTIAISTPLPTATPIPPTATVAPAPATATALAPTATPVPPTATATPVGQFTCGSTWTWVAIPALARRTGFYVVFSVPSTRYIVLSWWTGSQQGAQDLRLYAGNRFNGQPDPTGIDPPDPSLVGGTTGSDPTTIWSPQAVPAGTYSAYFYARGNPMGDSLVVVNCPLP
jgi:Flp pilus assembly protein TadG